MPNQEQEQEIAELVLSSDIHHIQALRENIAWRDLMTIGALKLEQSRDELETLGKADNAQMEDFAYIQGICFTLRYLLEWSDRREAELETLEDGDNDGEES
jgi:hypothetical protein